MLFTKTVATTMILLLLIIAFSSMPFNLSRIEVVGVVYAEENVPINGATVTITGQNASAIGTTDSSGNFKITNGIGTGNCSLTVTAPGYIDKTVTNIQVTAGSTVNAPAITLAKSGAIWGFVENPLPAGPPPPAFSCAGANVGTPGTVRGGVFGPLYGILAVATRTDGRGNASSYPLTDENGLYKITSGLPTGTYNVTVGGYGLALIGEPEGYVSKTISGVSVTAGQETPDVIFMLLFSGIISGNVMSFDGQPIFHALVTANSTTGGFSGYAYTDTTGSYRIATDLNAGNYTVTAKYENYTASRSDITVNPIEIIMGITVLPPEIGNVNFRFPISSTYGQLAGKTTDVASGQPLSGATIQIVGQGKTVTVTTDPKGYNSHLLSEGI